MLKMAQDRVLANLPEECSAQWIDNDTLGLCDEQVLVLLNPGVSDPPTLAMS